MCHLKLYFVKLSTLLCILGSSRSYDYRSSVRHVSNIPQHKLHLYDSAQTTKSQSTKNDQEYFDLTYTFDNTSIFYPGQRWGFDLLKDVGPTINRTTVGNYKYSYASWSFRMSEHGGTHIDAPFHFNKFGWRLHEIPLQRLVDVPVALVDVEKHVFSSRIPEQFLVQAEHLQEHEAKYGKIPDGAVLLVHLGWGKFWPDKLRYSGWDNSTSPGQTILNFPGISAKAINWLLKERNIVGVGTDSMSPDLGNHGGNPVVHILLLENQKYILENVANVDYLLHRTRSGNYPNGCDLRMHVLPIKTEGGGGPARIVAYCRKG